MLRKTFFVLYLALLASSNGVFGLTEKPRLFPVKVDDKVGYIDKTGNLLISPKFNYGGGFSEGFACVVVDGKMGFIDESGEYLVEPQFKSGSECFTGFEEGFAPINIEDSREIDGKLVEERRAGFIDIKGDVTFFPGIDYVFGFNEGLSCFKKDGLIGFMDKNFSVLIEPKFKSAVSFIDGLSHDYDDDGTVFYIDKTGRKLFNAFRGCNFQNGMACFEAEGKLGYLNTKGEVIIEPQFDGGQYFADNGLAAVKVGNEWGFIDKTGKLVIEPQFDDVGEFGEGLAVVVVGKKSGFINETGKIVIEPRFDNENYLFQGDICKVKVNGKTGYINKSGRFVWKPTK